MLLLVLVVDVNHQQCLEHPPLRGMPDPNLQVRLGRPVGITSLSLDADGDGAPAQGLMVGVVDGLQREPCAKRVDAGHRGRRRGQAGA